MHNKHSQHYNAFFPFSSNKSRIDDKSRLNNGNGLQQRVEGNDMLSPATYTHGKKNENETNEVKYISVYTRVHVIEWRQKENGKSERERKG